MPAVSCPWRGLQHSLYRFAAHTGNDDGIRFLCPDGIQARTQPEVDTLHLIFRRRLPGMLQRPRYDIRGNSARNAPFLQQKNGQIAMIRPHVGKACTLRHHVRQQPQPGL